MCRILTFGSIAMIFVLTAVGLAEPPMKEFKTFISKEGQFSVDLPGAPKVDVKKSESTKTYTFSVAFADPSILLFEVSYFDLPEATVRGADSQTLLKLLRSGYRKDAKFLEDKEINLGKEKIPGREYQLEPASGLAIREQLFLAGTRFYILHIGAQNNKDYLTSKEANRFFDSFQITNVTPLAPVNKEFRAFTSKEGGFMVKMPGAPEQKSKDLGKGAMEYDFEVRNGLEIYRVEIVDLGNAFPINKEAQLILKAFRSGFRQGAKFEGEKEITLGTDEFPGLEYQVDVGNGALVRERLYLVGKRIVTLHVVGMKKEFLTSKEANRFFDSFQITGSAADPKK
jgi:hypothetical protein